MKSDIEYMRLALLEAKKAFEYGEVPVGAVIVDKDGNVLGQGFNLKENSKLPILHAEIVSILDAHKNNRRMYLDGCTIYVTLEPCPMCASALVYERIHRIIYSASDNKYGACGSVFNLIRNDAMNHKIEVTGGLLKEESMTLIKTFFERLRD